MGVQSRRDDNGDTITVSKGERYYVARDDETGIASQGETKAEALENLADALELADRPVPNDVDEPADAPWF